MKRRPPDDPRQIPLVLPTVEEARAARDDGMETAADHAEYDAPGWRAGALSLFTAYAIAHKLDAHPFLTEDVRVYADQRGFPPPPDERAWGAIATKAVKAGIVRREGTRPARSSRMGFKSAWRKT